MNGDNATAALRRLARRMAAETIGDRTDRQLVEHFLVERNEAVFEVLVHRHGPMVYRVCWRVLQQVEDAEDAFQATFLVLARNLTAVRDRDSLASWLHGVAHRVALKARSLRATRRRHEALTPIPPAGPPDDLTWKELRSALDTELARLPEKWRLPLILCYLEGRTQDAAAAELGYSVNTLRRRLEAARAALGRRLSRRGFGSAALAAVLVADCASRGIASPGATSATIDAVTLLATGRATLSAIPPKVAALTEGVMGAMSVNKLKAVLAVLLAVVALGTIGSAFQSLQARVGQPPAGPRPGSPKPPELVVVPDPPSEERPGDTSLKGAWRVVSVKGGAGAFDAFRDADLVFVGERMIVVPNAPDDDAPATVYRVHLGAKRPLQEFDFYQKTNAGGTRSMGLYVLKGDQLRIAVSNKLGTRADTLESSKYQALIIAERVKD